MIKIVKSLEDHGLLIKDVIKMTENETKKHLPVEVHFPVFCYVH